MGLLLQLERSGSERNPSVGKFANRRFWELLSAERNIAENVINERCKTRCYRFA